MTIPRKLWQLLAADQRRKAVMILGFMLVGMVLEMLGIGLIIPALALMTQGDLAAKHPALIPLLDKLGHPTQAKLVVIGMLVLVGAYALKAVFLSVFTWQQMRFVSGVQADLAQRLYTGYLYQSYAFHLRRNSAELIRNVLNETSVFSNYVLIAGLTFLTESLVMAGISAMMLTLEPLGTILLIGILGAIGWLFHHMTDHRVRRWGEARQLHEGKRIQQLQQGLGGVKDVKLLGRESEFLSEFGLHNAGFARVSGLNATINLLPRLWLELLAVTGLAALIIVMIWRGNPVESILPTIGLFAVGAFRLAPSANRILSSFQNVRYGLPVISVLHHELNLAGNIPSTPNAAGPMPFSQLISLEQVTYRYPSAEAATLHGVTLQIPRGALVGFLGSTGGGKSTLVDVILGLLTPESGAVRVDGIDIQGNPRGWQGQIGYVPQSIFLTDDTLRRNVAFGLPNERIDEEAVWRAIRASALEAFVKELPAGLDTMVGERGVRLSGGQRQRIGIARALYHNPPVLVLDEATSSLDTATEREIVETVRALRGSKTILIVAHRLSTIENCDCLYRIEQGRVVQQGKAAAVLEDAQKGLSSSPL